MNLNKAEIHLIELDVAVGAEMQKTRPCVIIKPLDYYQLAVIIPLSSTTTFTTSYYTIVKIDSGTANLKTDSLAMCHHIRSVSYDRISRKIGTLPDLDFGKIMTALEDFIFDE